MYIDCQVNDSPLCLIDAIEIKQVSTRKLRRRPNDPVPIPEKRRKPSPDILSVNIQLCFGWGGGMSCQDYFTHFEPSQS